MFLSCLPWKGCLPHFLAIRWPVVHSFARSRICIPSHPIPSHPTYRAASAHEPQTKRVWTDYYTNSDVRESTGSLGVFLAEATAALEGTGASPEHLSRRFKAELLQTSERLDYHLDGDQPMVLYRFWNR